MANDETSWWVWVRRRNKLVGLGSALPMFLSLAQLGPRGFTFEVLAAVSGVEVTAVGEVV